MQRERSARPVSHASGNWRLPVIGARHEQSLTDRYEGWRSRCLQLTQDDSMSTSSEEGKGKARYFFYDYPGFA